MRRAWLLVSIYLSGRVLSSALIEYGREIERAGHEKSTRDEAQSRVTSNARSHDERCNNAEGPWELCDEHRAAFRAWAYGEPGD